MKSVSKKGVMIDFAEMIARSGSTVAVGNAKMNARGDLLTHGGMVEKTAEQVADQYYRNNPRAVTHTTSLSSIEDEILSPAEAIAKFADALPEKKQRRKTSED